MYKDNYEHEQKIIGYDMIYSAAENKQMINFHGKKSLSQSFMTARPPDSRECQSECG